MLGETWFSADFHFGHARILELGRGRPFSSIEEHDEAIVQRWNERVATGDVAFILGDVAMGDIAASLAMCKRLRGTKYLVSGNHDRTFAGARGQTPEKMAAWVARYREEGGFTGVNTWQHFASSRIATPHILRGDRWAPTRVQTSHFPWSATPGDERYAAWRPRERRGEWLLHGHVHTAWGVEGHQINVGVDVRDFTPMHTDEVLEIIHGGY